MSGDNELITITDVSKLLEIKFSTLCNIRYRAGSNFPLPVGKKQNVLFYSKSEVEKWGETYKKGASSMRIGKEQGSALITNVCNWRDFISKDSSINIEKAQGFLFGRL